MRRRYYLIIVVTAILGAMVVLLEFGTFFRSNGSANVLVILDAPKSIRSVGYADDKVDGNLRDIAERTADALLFNLYDAKMCNNEFVARIPICGRSLMRLALPFARRTILT